MIISYTSLNPKLRTKTFIINKGNINNIAARNPHFFRTKKKMDTMHVAIIIKFRARIPLIDIKERSGLKKTK